MLMQCYTTVAEGEGEGGRDTMRKESHHVHQAKYAAGVNLARGGYATGGTGLSPYVSCTRDKGKVCVKETEGNQFCVFSNYTVVEMLLISARKSPMEIFTLRSVECILSFITLTEKNTVYTY